MKKIILYSITALAVLGASWARAAGCEYATETVDAATGDRTISTELVRVSSMGSGVDGSLQGVTVGEEKFLGLRIKVRNIFPMPANLDILGDRHNPMLDDFLRALERDSLVVPAGSTLRITMEDRTNVVLTTAEAFKGRGSAEKRPSEGTWKKIAITADVKLQYPLDTEAIAALTAKTAINMRLETRDRYYSFGARYTEVQPVKWSKKSSAKFKEALNCVL